MSPKVCFRGQLVIEFGLVLVVLALLPTYAQVDAHSTTAAPHLQGKGICTRHCQTVIEGDGDETSFLQVSMSTARGAVHSGTTSAADESSGPHDERVESSTGDGSTCPAELQHLHDVLVQRLEDEHMATNVLKKPEAWQPVVSPPDAFVNLCIPVGAHSQAIASLWSGFNTDSILEMKQLERRTGSGCIEVDGEMLKVYRAPGDLPLWDLMFDSSTQSVKAGIGSKGPLDGCQGEEWPLARPMWKSMSRAYVEGFASWKPEYIFIMIGKPADNEQQVSWLAGSILFEDELVVLDGLLKQLPEWTPSIAVFYDKPVSRFITKADAQMAKHRMSMTFQSNTQQFSPDDAAQRIVQRMIQDFPEVSKHIVSTRTFSQFPMASQDGCRSES